VTYLYEDLGMPVISENTATMWGSLRKLRIKGRIPGINI
jgi:maleate cis-trans isomerase